MRVEGINTNEVGGEFERFRVRVRGLKRARKVKLRKQKSNTIVYTLA